MKVFLKRILPGLDGSFDIDRGDYIVHAEVRPTSFDLDSVTIDAVWVVDASVSGVEA